MDLPSVHFLCGHSFHKNCVDPNAGGCPHCVYKYQIDFASPPQPTEAEYFKDLKSAKDGFEVNAEYIGRGLFSKPVIQEIATPNTMDLSEEALESIPMEELKL